MNPSRPALAEECSTYNQVKCLTASDGWRSAFGLIVGALLLASAIFLPERWLVSMSLPVDLQAVRMGLAGVSLLVVFGVLVAHYRHRSKVSCKHCHKSLQLLARPVSLRGEYLGRAGVQLGGDLFLESYRGNPSDKQFWSPQRWQKIQNLSRVCHHCRVYESGYTSTVSEVSEHEMARVKEKMSHDRVA